ncbi:ADP-heptose:LPS heptosyltransferase [Soonwooa buanensis]|uniref:ADP-heptose:LPS heptosyltransferase n=1 Tax=Soonwooa buanensis TaxID=619805 RepID=A0A1T5EA75_9FLAO|nr:glycosyltransferase family 9 protein [Soonwooa buanensis]SKB80709.1 ADP-heptose:LPS heptosyltransferase [Soonwooa buanensis]
MKRILAYRFSAFGDVAMTVPVFREFLEQNKDVEVIFVSRKNFADLFDDVPNLKFHGVDFDQYKGLIGIRRLGREILNLYKPDYVADFHDVIRTKLIDSIAKRHGYNVFRINKGKEEKEHLTDVWNLDKSQLKRTVERYADILRSMGYQLILSQELRSRVTERQGIGFAPFAQHKGKMLPIEKSYELVKHLAKQDKVYFFGGGKEESEILLRWETEIPNTQSLAGKLSLKEELDVIARLKLMICMDSANMHLASLMGTRCVSIWGATHPYAGFLGYGQSLDDVVQVKDLTCRPCSVFGDKECYRGDYACLEELHVQQILDKI